MNICFKNNYRKVILFRKYCTNVVLNNSKTIIVNKQSYVADDWTNLTPKILSFIDRNIFNQKNHPISLIRQRIVKYFYKQFINSKGNPIFSVFDNLNPVVTIRQNFDELLIPSDHPSRNKSDCYYVNSEYLLRAHTTAHQADLIKSGLDNFLIVGEVYRRDEIDSTHYPVFHQIDAVRTIHRDKLFKKNLDLEIFESSYKINPDSFEPVKSSLKCIDQAKQPCHTLESMKLIEHELKTVLIGLIQNLFGNDIKYRWIDTHFPFTQPSWELEIFYNNNWLEVLGSGIIRNEILQKCGVENTIGYAFGIGIERLAMILYDIPDIRLFWSTDSGFLNQFICNDNIDKSIKYKPISSFPQCTNDLSFWLPDTLSIDDFPSNDFYDMVRTIGGDMIEQVKLVDKFTHPKTGKSSMCFRIVYRHMERTLTQKEVNEIHSNISNDTVKNFGVEIR